MKIPIYFRASTALIFDKQNRVLLLKRNELLYRGYWQLPEGWIGKEELAKNAIKREIKEELGVNCTSVKKLFVSTHPAIHKNIPVYIKRFVYSTKISGEISLSSEHSQYIWVDKSEALKKKLVMGTREILLNI